jgi:hypothetical protein
VYLFSSFFWEHFSSPFALLFTVALASYSSSS